VLAGLGGAQTKWHFVPPTDSASTGAMMSGYQWVAEPLAGAGQVYDEEDRVGALDPVFVVPVGVAARTRAYFESRGF
jgi:protein farnesyltransferase subunit beta